MKYVFTIFLLLFLSACNLNQNIAIRGVDLHSHDINGATYVDLETIVSLGNLKLPNSIIPIKNSEQHELGEVSVQHLDDGTSRVAISINYDEASKIDSGLGKTLPNGREIPTLLENETPLIGIPISDHSRVYIGGNPQGILYSGIALNVPAFDHILTSVPVPLNLFIPFPFSEEVMGIAGIYSGPQNGENGLAIFAKKAQQTNITQKINPRGPSPKELKKMDKITLFRLNYLFSKHATLRIK